MTQKCCYSVWRSGAWKPSQCARAGKVERAGKLFCAQHDPVARKEKEEALYRRWDTEREARHKAHRFQTDCIEAIRQIAAGHNDPRTLAQSIIDALEAP